ncbi:hypothetical protein AVEN_270194-1, partial [Araneus ventricosus]
DDDGQVHESVVEKVVEKCPKKEKENPSSKASEYHCLNSSSSSEDESSSPEKPSNLNQRVRKEKENTKISSKVSSIKKSRLEKYKKRKSKEASKCSL